MTQSTSSRTLECESLLAWPERAAVEWLGSLASLHPPGTFHAAENSDEIRRTGTDLLRNSVEEVVAGYRHILCETKITGLL